MSAYRYARVLILLTLSLVVVGCATSVYYEDQREAFHRHTAPSRCRVYESSVYALQNGERGAYTMVEAFARTLKERFANDSNVVSFVDQYWDRFDGIYEDVFNSLDALEKDLSPRDRLFFYRDYRKDCHPHGLMIIRDGSEVRKLD